MIDYMDMAEKAKKLLERFKNFEGGDLEKKLKHQKKLEILAKFDAEKFKGSDMQFTKKILQNSDVYVNAYNFLKDGGVNTFENEVFTASKGKKMAIFNKYADTFTDEEYWQNLAETYIMQEYMELPYFFYKELFSSTRSKKEMLMNDADRLFLEQLPEMITIYRGGAEKESETEYGVSWTLNETIAEQFVYRKKHSSKDAMVVHKLIIQKSKAVAYFNSRQEEEIIYLGES